MLAVIGCKLFVRSVSIPAPHGAVVTHADQRVSVLGERGLPDGRGALGVGEDGVVDQGGLRHLQVPHVGAPHLVTQRQHPLRRVQREPHEPNLAVPQPDLVDDRHLVVRRLALLLHLDAVAVVDEARLPAHYRVLTRLGEDEVTEPFTAVHVVSVDISCAEVREMAELRGEDFLGF